MIKLHFSRVSACVIVAPDLHKRLAVTSEKLCIRDNRRHLSALKQLRFFAASEGKIPPTEK